MTETNIVAFHQSFERCMASGRFFDIFYDHFLKSSPEVAAQFHGTDFNRQKWMLKMSLYLMVSALVLRNADYSTLKTIALRHSRSERSIPPHLYIPWLDSLIVAAKTCDPIFNDQLEALWRQAMRPGIDYIVSLY